MKSFRKISGLLVVCTAFFLAETVFPQARSEKAEDGFVPDVLWRSAVLPGWGQVRHGRAVVGKRFMVGFWSAFTVNLILWRDYRAKLKDHDFATTRLLVETPFFSATPSLPVVLRNFQDAGRTREELEASSRMMNLSFLALMGIYSWNLVDAWWFHLRDRTHLSIQVGVRKFQFMMEYRF